MDNFATTCYSHQMYALTDHSRLIKRDICFAAITLQSKTQFRWRKKQGYHNCFPEDEVERSRWVQNVKFVGFGHAVRQVQHYMWACSCQTCLWQQPHPREHIRDWFGMTLVLMFVYALKVELWQRKVSVSPAPPRGRSRTLKVSAECQIVDLFNAIVVDTQCSVRL